MFLKPLLNMRASLTTIVVIVSTLLLLVACSKPTPYLAITDVTGYSLNKDGELFEFSTMVWADDLIVAIGDADILSDFPDAQISKRTGAIVLPGLIDAHGHVIGLGQNLMQVDLRGVESQEAAVHRINEFLANNETRDGWVIGRGWNQVLWEDKSFPTKNILDKHFPEQPVVLERVDGHAYWVNSKALSLAGISRDINSPSGGEIIKNSDGNPTGVLIDTAMDYVNNAMPSPSIETYRLALSKASEHLLSVGLTSVHDAGIDNTTYQLYKDAASADQLDIRIYAMLSATDPNFDSMLTNGFIKDDDNFLSIRSVKAYGDGALGSRGAALVQPYNDDPDNRGLLVTEETELKRLANQVSRADFQMNIHAIGDRSNNIVLDIFEDINKPQLRPRVEHAQVVIPADIPRFAQLDVIPSMQPVHATSDMNMAEERIGTERLEGAYAWQTFLETGSRIAAGSDFPVELANPFHGLFAAATRMNHKLQPKDGWIPEQALSLPQAFKAFTLDAAYAAHQEDLLGTLETGKKADFIIVNQDIFRSPISELWQTEVLETWVNGELKYSNSEQ